MQDACVECAPFAASAILLCRRLAVSPYVVVFGYPFNSNPSLGVGPFYFYAAVSSSAIVHRLIDVEACFPVAVPHGVCRVTQHLIRGRSRGPRRRVTVGCTRCIFGFSVPFYTHLFRRKRILKYYHVRFCNKQNNCICAPEFKYGSPRLASD